MTEHSALNKRLLKSDEDFKQAIETIVNLQRSIQDLHNDTPAIQEEFRALREEVQVIRYKAKSAKLYHHWMENFKNLKMECALIMRSELMIYQLQKACKIRLDQWEVYEGKLPKSLLKTFASFR
ncbi:unnamed protein product [Sphagnum balticum]